jgi:hypothetical protein
MNNRERMMSFFSILKYLVTTLKFHSVRIRKCIVILFQKNRKLEKISIDYFKKWHSENSYLLVDLKFRNAIYLKVGDTKSFDFTKPLILNLQTLNTDSIKVEVFGFFQKQIFIIESNKEIQLNSKPFRTTIENISPVEITIQKTRSKIPNIFFIKGKPKVIIKSISINPNHITININKFNIQEYL